MKRMLPILLGLFLAGALPCLEAQGQSSERSLSITVSTLDRAPLASATIYAGIADQAYFVDSAHLDANYSGSAFGLSTLTTSQALTVTGNVVSGSVDSATFATSMVVILDSNGMYYVLSNASRAQRDSGIFYPQTLFATPGTVEVTISPILYMLGRTRIVARDSQFNRYSSLAAAARFCDRADTLVFMDTVMVDTTVVFNHGVMVKQNGYPVVSTITDNNMAAFLIEGAHTTVTWMGNDTVNAMTMPVGTIFRVLDSARFGLGMFKGSAGSTVLDARSGSPVIVLQCELSSTSTDAPVMFLDNKTIAMVRMSQFNGGRYAVYVPDTPSMAAVIVDTASLSGIISRSYVAATTRINSDLQLLCNNIYSVIGETKDTAWLMHSTPEGMSALVEPVGNSIVFDLNQDTIYGTLTCNHRGPDTLSLVNGVIGTIKGVDSTDGVIRLAQIDSVGTLIAGGHTVVIDDARVSQLHPLTGGNIVIKGGKFNQDCSNYLAYRHTMIDNPDADAASFSKKVLSGFKVTLHNFNSRGEDSIVVYDRPDNKIGTAPALPAYLPADTVLVAYWADSSFTTLWNFQEDVLTQDTVLYAQWKRYDALTDVRYTVKHRLMNLDSTFVVRDTVTDVVARNTPLVVNAFSYEGFTPDSASRSFAQLTQDTTIIFTYSRNRHALSWVLNGGVVDGSFNANDTLPYGAPIIYPSIARPGHLFYGWTPEGMVTMPDSNLVLTANFTAHTFYVTWTAPDTAVYTGTAITGVSAVFTKEDNTVDSCTITLMDADGNLMASLEDAGVYYAVATPHNPDYTIYPRTKRIVILPAEVSISGYAVDTVKWYDGNAVAHVSDMGTLSGRLGSDDLTHSVSARYTDSTVSSGKSILVFFTLHGADSANYVVDSSSVIASTQGAILEPMVLDTNAVNNGISVDADGYCVGDAAGIIFSLISGTPNQYKLVFDNDAQAQGFSDVDWTALSAGGNIAFDVPLNAHFGTYHVNLILRNSSYPTFESAPIAIAFQVNLPRAYTRPIFNDVITIVDTCGCIDHNSVRWYHNGVYVGSGAYYQEDGGLTGTYYATMAMNGVATRTCEQDSLGSDNYPEEHPTVTVSVYPNPAVDRTTVKVEHSTAKTHHVVVMSVVGVMVYNGSFDGSEASLDLSALAPGSYTVSVDGIVSRLIKK